MMIWAVGLRGAVAYGLALNLPQIESESDEGIPAIESATLVIVVLSTLILGSATGPLLRRFDLQVMPWLHLQLVCIVCLRSMKFSKSLLCASCYVHPAVCSSGTA